MFFCVCLNLALLVFLRLVCELAKTKCAKCAVAFIMNAKSGLCAVGKTKIIVFRSVRPKKNRREAVLPTAAPIAYEPLLAIVILPYVLLFSQLPL